MWHLLRKMLAVCLQKPEDRLTPDIVIQPDLKVKGKNTLLAMWLVGVTVNVIIGEVIESLERYKIGVINRFNKVTCKWFEKITMNKILKLLLA